jgi:hypothetical protein
MILPRTEKWVRGKIDVMLKAVRGHIGKIIQAL